MSAAPLSDEQLAEHIVAVVTLFDRELTDRRPDVMYRAFASLMAELAHQVKINTSPEQAIQMLVEVAQETAAGTHCNIQVHTIRDRGRPH